MVSKQAPVRNYPERIAGYFTKAQRMKLERAAWKKRQTVAEFLREMVDAL